MQLIIKNMRKPSTISDRATCLLLTYRKVNESFPSQIRYQFRHLSVWQKQIYIATAILITVITICGPGILVLISRNLYATRSKDFSIFD